MQEKEVFFFLGTKGSERQSDKGFSFEFKTWETKKSAHF
jgi:hypothetical protein